jgi:hypothetical protein
MDPIKPKNISFLTLNIMLILFNLVACNRVEGSLQVWIDHPRQGAAAPLGVPLEVVSHAYARQGISELVLLVNGEAVRRDPPVRMGATLSEGRQEWLPPAPGSYTLQLTAYDNSGEQVNSNLVSVLVLPAVAATLAPDTPTTIPSPEITTGLPDLEITSVEAIVGGYNGEIPFCTPRIVYRNASEAPVPLDFSIQFLLNGVVAQESQISGGLPGGASAELNLDTQFEGAPTIGIILDPSNTIVEGDEGNNTFSAMLQCGEPLPPTATFTTPPATNTPTPTQPAGDTQPPPIPSPAVPANGLEIQCKSEQTLVWLPVSDPSGLAGYEVRLERRASPDNNWQSTGLWGLINEKQHTVAVECGYYYRWSVRAQDSAGNTSNWSTWFTFAILLQ